MKREQDLDREIKEYFNKYYFYYEIDKNNANNKSIIHAKVFELISKTSTVTGADACAKLHDNTEEVFDRILNSNKLKYRCCIFNKLDELLVDSQEDILNVSGIDWKTIPMCKTSNILFISLNAFLSTDSIQEFLHRLDYKNFPTTEVIITLILLMVVSFAAWLLARRSKESEEFRFLAEFNGRTWARKLAETDVPFRKFTIIEAWQKADLSCSEVLEAVSALDGKFGFSKISTNQGEKFNSSIMQGCKGKGNRFVYYQRCTGLKLNDKVIEKAQVDLCTEDYVALEILKDHRVTTVFLQQLDGNNDELPSSFVIEKQDLIELMPRANDQDLDDWLKHIANAVPSGDLKLVEVRVGDKYREREMINENRENTPVLAKAKVKSVHHVGLKRNGDVLFKARVIAVDSDEE